MEASDFIFDSLHFIVHLYELVGRMGQLFADFGKRFIIARIADLQLL